MPRTKRIATVIRTRGCIDHRPLTLGYAAWHEEAERRGKRGMKQRLCPDCTLWYWRDEWGLHSGWDKATLDG